ncbi:hypothetical protein sos41_34990 [Alphaproteobacteria bacterium SO-S41]|nr:hypothetical protein sos41_34990 [Alphaproteobacteria bacterium SO-S41]
MLRIAKWTGLVLLAVIVLALAVGSYFLFINPSISMTLNKQTFLMLRDDPELLTQLGAVEGTLFDFHSGELDDASWVRKVTDRKTTEDYLAQIRSYDVKSLTGQDKLTYEVMDWFYDTVLRYNQIDWLAPGGPMDGGTAYPVNQMFGVQNGYPRFMQFQHVVINEKTARHYIDRLNAVGVKFDQVIDVIRRQAAMGALPPTFVFDKVLAEMNGFVGKPIKENPLYTTYFEKLTKLDIDGDKKAAFAAEAEQAINNTVYPAYRRLIALMVELRPQSTADAGVWKQPQGDAFYALALRQQTTTDMTPQEVHDLGLSEVARIEAEMDTILKAQGYADGTVGDRMRALGESPEQNWDDSDAGRQAIMDEYTRIIADMKARLPEAFAVIPPQPVEVARVPPFAEGGSAGAYYEQPALDGSRPGRFFANLRDVKETQKFGMKTLAYHEAIPGHHMQIATAMNLDIPLARSFLPFTAYVEGWALYAEQLAWEMGAYKDDPLGDLGRLQAELYRAVRLVVDTGMHYKHWSREQAIDYMASTTGSPLSDVTAEIERYSVMPGQACAYKIGMMKILELRERAKAKLGAKFDLKAFHTVVLENGPLPLTILEEVVDQWIAAQT